MTLTDWRSHLRTSAPHRSGSESSLIGEKKIEHVVGGRVYPSIHVGPLTPPWCMKRRATMTLEVWELLEHALRQQYSTGQSQNRAPSVENSGRVIMKNPHFCLSVFVGKYMTTTYTKACDVDFETLGSIKSCLEPPTTNRPGSQLSVLGENKRVCHTHTHTHTYTHPLTHSLTV